MSKKEEGPPKNPFEDMPDEIVELLEARGILQESTANALDRLAEIQRTINADLTAADMRDKTDKIDKLTTDFNEQANAIIVFVETEAIAKELEENE